MSDVAGTESTVRPRSRRRKGKGSAARTVLVAAGAMVALGVAGLTSFGFPSWATRAILARFNKGEYFCDLSRLTLDPRGGIVAHDVRLYRKGTVGPAFLEAAEVNVRFNVLFWRYRGYGTVREVLVRRGVARPAFHRRAVEAAQPSAAGGGAKAAPSQAGGLARARVEVTEFDVGGTWVQGGACEVWRKGVAWGVSRCSATIGRDLERGPLNGSMDYDAAGRLTGQCTAGFDPRALAPLLRALDLPGEDILRRFSFSTMPPSCEVAFEHVPGAAERWHMEGRLQANGFAYHGTPIDFGNVTASYDWSASVRSLSIKSLVLVVGGQNISGAVFLDLAGGTVDFSVVSTADVLSFLRIAGLREGMFGPPLNTGRNTRLYAKGRVGLDDPAKTAAEISVDGEGLGYGGFVSEACSFKLLCQGATNTLSDVKGRIAGGSFTGSAVLEPAGDDLAYRVRAEIIHADLGKLLSMASSNAGERCSGWLYGNVELSGLSGKPPSAVGQGSVSMKQGVVFRLPLFGGMTDALVDVVPGLNRMLDQTDVRIPFEIRDSRVWTRDAAIEGNLLSLTAKGSGGFDGSLDFDVQVRPMKEKGILSPAVRLLTSPVSRLLELKLEGTVTDPRWRTARFSKGPAGPGSGTEERKDRP